MCERAFLSRLLHIIFRPSSLRSRTVTKSPFLFPIQLPPLSRDVGGGSLALCVFVYLRLIVLKLSVVDVSIALSNNGLEVSSVSVPIYSQKIVNCFD